MSDRAFISVPAYWTLRNRSHQHCTNPKLCMTIGDSAGTPKVSRRTLLSGVTVAMLTNALSALPADAKVDIDIERFGDKELKVSTINKVKQNVRNVLTQKPELLPYFFRLTLHDALTYDPTTEAGGPNGSLRLELDRVENEGLKAACEEIQSIQSLQRQDMSFADTCAFAGAVAVEVTGGPRIVVQLGREDAAQADPQSTGSKLYTTGASAEDMRKAFQSAGLDGSRDVVLFHGAIGLLNDIGQSRAEKLRESAISEDDEDEDDADRDDVTYGKVTKGKRGAVLVESNVSLLTLGGQKFSNSYLKALTKAKDRTKLSQRDIAIMDDKGMMGQVQSYADNNSKFINDVADLFQKVSLLGSSFESMTFRD